MEDLYRYGDIYFNALYWSLVVTFISDLVITFLVIGKPIKFTGALYRSTNKKSLAIESAVKICMVFLILLGMKDRNPASSGILKIAIVYIILLGWAIVDLAKHFRRNRIK